MHILERTRCALRMSIKFFHLLCREDFTISRNKNSLAVWLRITRESTMLMNSPHASRIAIVTLSPSPSISCKNRDDDTGSLDVFKASSTARATLISVKVSGRCAERTMCRILLLEFSPLQLLRTFLYASSTV